MRQYERSLRMGLTVVLCSLLLRLFAQGVPRAAAGIQDFLIHLETGQAVRSPSFWEPVQPGESASPMAPPETEPVIELPTEEVPRFTAEDAALVRLYNTSGKQVEPEKLLLEPLPAWTEKKVLLFSTHATESYTPGQEPYTQTSAFRTTDEDYNMLSLGAALEALLQTRGITVLRDTALHDYPSYNGAYSHARKALTQYIKKEPGIALALDLHRDAADSGSGQLRTRAQVEGKSAAQIMLVVGTDARGLRHPRWRENLALALKLQVLLERLCPGITRPICLRPQRFNQDVAPGCLIVELGGAGNTRQEALNALPVLAQAISQLVE